MGTLRNVANDLSDPFLHLTSRMIATGIWHTLRHPTSKFRYIKRFSSPSHHCHHCSWVSIHWPSTCMTSIIKTSIERAAPYVLARASAVALSHEVKHTVPGQQVALCGDADLSGINPSYLQVLSTAQVPEAAHAERHMRQAQTMLDTVEGSCDRLEGRPRELYRKACSPSGVLPPELATQKVDP